MLEIFGCPNNTPFAGLSIIVVGDFLQLPQVPFHVRYNDSWQNLVSLWNLFEIVELPKVIRQRGDGNFIDLLNHVRIAELNNTDVSLLRSKFIKPNDKYPQDALHIFAENAPAHMLNITMLSSIENQLHKIDVKDRIPKNISSTKIESILKRNQSETGRLASTLQIKLNVRVMLTMNVDRSPFDASLGVYSVQSAGTHSRCFDYGRMCVALIRVASSDNFYFILLHISFLFHFISYFIYFFFIHFISY